MVEDLTDADAPFLMKMVEDVRAELAERSVGQQGEAVETSENVENDKRVPVAQSKRVKLYGPNEEPEIDGARVPPLTVPRYDVVLALVEAEDGLVRDGSSEKVDAAVREAS